jgi:hypothetical protein
MHSRWISQNKNTGSHQLNDLQLVKQTASNCRELLETFECVSIIIMIAILEFENEGPILLIYHLPWTNSDFFTGADGQLQPLHSALTLPGSCTSRLSLAPPTPLPCTAYSSSHLPSRQAGELFPALSIPSITSFHLENRLP